MLWIPQARDHSVENFVSFAQTGGLKIRSPKPERGGKKTAPSGDDAGGGRLL